MPWCPKCKCEYKEGISVCADCKVPLIMSEDGKNSFIPTDLEDVVSFEDKKLADKFFAFLQYEKITSDLRYDEESATYIVSTRKKDVKIAKKHFSCFYAMEADNIIKEELSSLKETNDSIEENDEYEQFDWNNVESAENKYDNDDMSIEPGLDIMTEQEEKPVRVAAESSEFSSPSATYERKSNKAKDVYSSAVVFISFGIIGIAFIVLNITGIISIINTTLVYVAFSAMFVAFMIIGIRSLRSYKRLSKEAASEEQFTKQINEWLMVSYTKESLQTMLEELIKQDTISKEVAYIRLLESIKQSVTDQFGQIDDAYLDLIIEEFYNNTSGIDEDVSYQ